MHSIRIRLNVLFVVIVTLVLAISGTYSQHKLSEELEMRNSQLQQGVLTRLQISLPSALWDLDKTKVGSILEAEMLPAEVVAIRVFDTTVGLFTGKVRGPSGQIVGAVDATVIAGKPTEAELVFRGSGTESGAIKPVTVGRAVINFSRAKIDAVLTAELVRKVIEILLLDLMLVVALSFSLQMVFEPLKQLRDGLFDLAIRDTDEVVELPESRRDEFGDVVRGFNRIQRKLKSVIEHTRQAEDAARSSSDEAAAALHELRQAQDSLIQAERLASLGGLVAGVAHEINTPVGITLTSASVLLDATEQIAQAMAAGGVKKSEIVNYLEVASESTQLIMSNANRAAQLIQSFKQIAVDQTSEVRRSFGLKEYIDEVITSLRPRLRQTRIRIVVDCPIEISIDSYPGAFAQILTNLTMNALSHAFEPDTEGQIDIGVRQEGIGVILHFCDNGKGIPAEFIDKVFDPFFTTQRGQGGTGLGLNVVYNIIVKQFGGTIGVISTLGQGADFIIRIPRMAPQKEQV